MGVRRNIAEDAPEKQTQWALLLVFRAVGAVVKGAGRRRAGGGIDGEAGIGIYPVGLGLILV
jgi:hypothetical protein